MRLHALPYADQSDAQTILQALEGICVLAYGARDDDKYSGALKVCRHMFSYSLRKREAIANGWECLIRPNCTVLFSFIHGTENPESCVEEHCQLINVDMHEILVQ